jgi:hypothetical protein
MSILDCRSASKTRVNALQVAPLGLLAMTTPDLLDRDMLLVQLYHITAIWHRSPEKGGRPQAG